MARLEFTVQDFSGRDITVLANKNGCLPRCDLDGNRLRPLGPDGPDGPDGLKAEYTSNIVLRQDQEACTVATEHTEGLLLLKTGFGKTIVALDLVARLRYKACIIVDMSTLYTQWVSEIEKWLPGTSISTHKNPDPEADIGVYMIQSLVSNHEKWPLESWYSVCIVDEVHTMCSELRYNWFLYHGMNFKHLYGMTATPERLDNLHPLLNCIFGKVLVSNLETLKKQQTLVKVHQFSYKLKTHMVLNYYTQKNRIDYGKMLDQVIKNTERTAKIIDIIVDLVQTDPERRVLIMSDRVDHVTEIAQALESKLNVSIATVCGTSWKKSGKTLDEIKQCVVIVGTFSILGKAFSAVSLNTLVFASPKKTISQAVGRIFRVVEHKVQPRIYDFTDNHGVFRKQQAGRIDFYHKEIDSVLVETVSL